MPRLLVYCPGTFKYGKLPEFTTLSCKKLRSYHPALLAQLSPKDFQSTTRPSRPELSALNFGGGSLGRHNVLHRMSPVMINHNIKAADA